MSTLPGWKNMPLGCHIADPGCAHLNHTGSWRSMRPIWDHAPCIKCGICDLYCPEACVKPDADGLYEANLDYCKGCGICGKECPVQCISMKQEEE